MRVDTAAILAGGAGRRLGGVAKEGLRLGGEELGPRLAGLLARRFDTIIVVSKDWELYRDSASGSPPLVVGDAIPGFGPLSGLHAALSATDSDWLWLAACDMPAFDPRFVDLLVSRLEAALETAGGPGGGPPPLACLGRHGDHFEPFQALYSRRLLPRLEGLFAAAALAAAGGSEAGAATPSRAVLRPSFKELFAGQSVLFLPEEETRTLSPDWALFFNINTPEDLARLG